MINKSTLFRVKLDEDSYLTVAEFKTGKGFNTLPYLDIIKDETPVVHFLGEYDDKIETIGDLKTAVYNSRVISKLKNEHIDYFRIKLDKIDLDILLFESDELYEELENKGLGLVFVTNKDCNPIIFLDDTEFEYEGKPLEFQYINKTYIFDLNDKNELRIISAGSYEYFDIYEDDKFHSVGIIFNKR